jgi:para-nitrobenzyl esterase
MDPVIAIASGRIRGVALGAATAFLGIPYAASTADDHRFLAPQAVDPWTGVRDAGVFGPAAPQLQLDADGRAMTTATSTPLARALMSLLYPHSGSPVAGTFTSEDCLVLNVWTPATSRDERLPVMVWFHGGAFLHGAGSEPTFWGDRLAAGGDVVVVTVNHRLGALGYLHLDDDRAPDAAQAGMLDLVAALAWVRDNIGEFGGDPANVTVFGQSGGGMKISALMAMPSAAGLFQKAIIQSGAGLQLTPPQTAARLTAALFDALGIPPGDLDALRAVPHAHLVAAQFAAMAAVPEAPTGFGPVVDGTTIVSDPLSGTASSAPSVPLLIGCTSEESAMFLAMDPSYEALDDAALEQRLAGAFGADAPAVLDAYRGGFPRADARELLRRIETDRDIRVSNRHFVDLKYDSSTAPVFNYLFDYPTGVLDGAIGAGHSVDLAFVFGNADRIPLSGTREGRDEVQRQVVAAWTAFAHTGDPSTPLLPAWPAHSGAHETMVFGWPDSRLVTDPDGERLALVEAHPSRLFPRRPAAADA